MVGNGRQKNYDLDQFCGIFGGENEERSWLTNHVPAFEEQGDHRSQGAERFL